MSEDGNKRPIEEFSFTCSCCGENHEGLPALVQAKPPYYYDIPEAEREQRIKITDDLCAIDDEFYFIRVTLSIPISGYSETFEYGLWATQSKENYDRYAETINEDQGDTASYGTICVDMWGWKRNIEDVYLEDLKCDVYWQDGNQRPRIVFHESDHPLAIAQHEGISPEKAKELLEFAFHGELQ